MNYDLCLLSMSILLTFESDRGEKPESVVWKLTPMASHVMKGRSGLLYSNVGAFSPACDGAPVTTGTSVKKEGIRGSRCQADSRRGGP